MTASPISDLNPIWMVLQSKVKVADLVKTSMVTVDSKFFTGYRKTCIGDDQIIINIELPYMNKVSCESGMYKLEHINN